MKETIISIAPLLLFQHFTREAIRAKGFSLYTTGDVREALERASIKLEERASNYFEEQLKVIEG